MSGRKSKGVFYGLVGNRGSLCPRDVLDTARDLLSVASLVGADNIIRFGDCGSARLALVERQSRELVGGRI